MRISDWSSDVCSSDLLFAFVGALGLIVHLAVLGIMVDVLDQGFREGQTMAVLTAMTFNFVLNNRLTYRDMRLKGAAFIKGLFTFYAVCLVGAIGNIGVGEMIYVLDTPWGLGGPAGGKIGKKG